MGYELNRLMREYGVTTPGVAEYTGAQDPGKAPVAPTAPVLPEKANKAQRAKFKADTTAYNAALEKYNVDRPAFEEQLKKYGLEKGAYDEYRNKYFENIRNTPMYSQSQFQTGLNLSAPGAVSDSYGSQRPTLTTPSFGTSPSSQAATTEPMMAPMSAANAMAPMSAANVSSAAAPAQPVAGPSGQKVFNFEGRPMYMVNTVDGPQWMNYTGDVGDLSSLPGVSSYTGWADARRSVQANPIGFPGPAASTTPAPAPAPSAPAEPVAGPSGQTVFNLEGRPMYMVSTQSGPQWQSYTGDVSSMKSLPAAASYTGWADARRSTQKRPIGFAAGGSVNDLAEKYEVGGAVRRFQTGGSNRTPRYYESPENEAEFDARFVPELAGETFAVPSPDLRVRGMSPEDLAPRAAPAPAPQPVTASPAAQPVMPPPSPTTPVSPAATDLMSMLQRYTSAESTYGPELAAARKRATAENAAFQDMIAKAIKPDGTAPDKTEMYFRLAAAFGSPSKTGQFTENLALAGKEMADYAKDVRASKKADQALRLQLGLEAQKLKAQGAKEELATLRALAGEEMKDKRAVLLEYMKSGRPQSEAGKAAVDAGLTQGTPEFTEYVNKYIDDKIRSGNLLKEAMVAISAGGLQVRQAAEKRQAEASGKLTPAEVKLKSEAEVAMGSIEDAMGSLKRAYSLNPNTFEGTWASIAQQKILEQTDPKDPRVLATREQRNLLSKGAISNLRAAFGGNPTEGERTALLNLEGLDAKSKDERARIMKNTYRLLKQRRDREQKRLDDIKAGSYREINPSSGDLD